MLGCYAICLVTVLALLWTLPAGGWVLVLALVAISPALLTIGDHKH